MKFAFGAPPPLLQRLLLWRVARASARAFGLSALHAVVSACGDAWQPLVTEALLPLRPALRSHLERDARSPPPGAVAAATAQPTWLARHHYLQDLEACPSTAVDVVQVRWRSRGLGARPQ